MKTQKTSKQSRPVNSKTKKIQKAKKPAVVVKGVSAAKIKEASKRIRPIVQVTPLERSNTLSGKYAANVFVKHEEAQCCGAFKLRGVTNHLKSISPAQRKKGVVTASTGNHGVAVAYASKLLDADATIYLCENVPANKVQNIKDYGAKVEFVKGYCLEAQIKALADAKKYGRYYIHPYNSTTTVCGAGTMGLEIWEQMKALNVKKIDAVFACVGGGGLFSGVSTFLKAQDPSIKCYGVSARRTPAMYECLKAGDFVTIPPTVPSVADGNGGNLEKGCITFNIMQQNCEEIILVDEDDIKQATRWYVEHEHTIVEPTAAVALAGF